MPMKKMLLLYLILRKEYSVMRLNTREMDTDDKWAACDSAMSFDFGHDGTWGTGNTPCDAVIDCWRKSKRKAK